MTQIIWHVTMSLVDEIVVHVAPVPLGDGVRLYAATAPGGSRSSGSTRRCRPSSPACGSG